MVIVFKFVLSSVVLVKSVVPKLFPLVAPLLNPDFPKAPNVKF